MRLWDDMPTDPKWRVIARKSGQRIGDVIAMFNILLIQGGENADERGRTRANDDDDIAAALDLDPDDVAAIRAAMQGKVLDGDVLTGWDKRQPKREDAGSAGRAKRWREKKKAENADNENASERKRTQANGEKRPDSDSDSDADRELPNGSRRARSLALQPEDVDPVVWRDFQRLRREKHAPLTETALKGIQREVAKLPGLTLNAALVECCERGWRGFKADWMKEGGSHGRSGKPSGWQ